MNIVQKIFDSLSSIKKTRPRLFFGLLLSLPLYTLIRLWAAGTYCKKSQNLAGKVVAITGANTGIGYETAKKLASMGAKVLLLCRDKQRGQRARDQIVKQTGNTEVILHLLDLSSKQSIEECAHQVNARNFKIDILINNAGVMGLPKLTMTKDGVQRQIGTNHLGHFYLTALLFDKLKDSKEGRVINVSSKASLRTIGKSSEVVIDFQDLCNYKNYHPLTNYSISKLCNVMFAKELNQRCREKKIRVKAVSLHPGVVNTQLVRGFQLPFYAYLLTPLFWLFSKNCYQGAQTTLHACLADYDELEGGAYYDECRPVACNPFANDRANNIRLWELSEEFANMQFKIERN